jgi:hypothetical protein
MYFILIYFITSCIEHNCEKMFAIYKTLTVFTAFNMFAMFLVAREKRSISLDVNIDALNIASEIANASQGDKRDEFVKDIIKTARHSTGGNYNLMVFNLGQKYEEKLNDIKFYATTKYGYITYGIWIFESGTFQNKGDGGWINWVFYGRFKRNDGFVRFFKIE